jgi:hypothetical protein
MTTAAPHRISPLRWLAAEAATWAFGPDHHGVDEQWLADLRNAVTTSQPGVTDTAVIPAVRAAAAIAAQPHREVHDEHLGVLYVAGREPPRLYHALASVNTVNGGAS